MANYYLIEVLTYMDETQAKSKSIYEYESIDLAKGHAKQDMGNWILNDTCKSIGVMVLTETFATVTQDYWERYIPEPEPEPEPEVE